MREYPGVELHHLLRRCDWRAVRNKCNIGRLLGYPFKMNRLKVPSGTRATSWIVATTMLAAAVPALAQVPAAPRLAPPRAASAQPARPAAQTAPKPTGPAASRPDAPVPGNPDFAPEIVSTPSAIPTPPPLPPAVWDVATAQDLLA